MNVGQHSESECNITPATGMVTPAPAELLVPGNETVDQLLQPSVATDVSSA